MLAITLGTRRGAGCPRRRQSSAQGSIGGGGVWGAGVHGRLIPEDGDGGLRSAGPWDMTQRRGRTDDGRQKIANDQLTAQNVI